MKKHEKSVFKQRLLPVMLTLAMGLGLTSNVQATGVYAYSHQDIDNLTMTFDGNGSIDFQGNLFTSTAASASHIDLAGCANVDPTDTARCLIGGPDPRENNFAEQAHANHYVRSDAIIRSSDLLAGGDFENVAELFMDAADGGDHFASSDGENEWSGEFKITEGADGAITFNLEAIVKLITQVHFGDEGSALAEVGFNIHIDESDKVNHNVGPHAFDWSPSELNHALSSLNSGESHVYNFSDPLSSTTDLLSVGTLYDVTLTMDEKVTATSIPEPSTVFLLTTGLVAIGYSARRRKKNTQ